MTHRYRSVFGSGSQVDRHAMAAERPVPALTALLVANNVQHMVDMACQYRVSWMASTSGSEVGTGYSTDLRLWSQYSWEFAPSITDSTLLPSFELSVGGRLTGFLSSVDVTASIRSTTGNGRVYTTMLGGPFTSTTAEWRHDPFAITEDSVEQSHWKLHTRALTYQSQEVDGEPSFFTSAPKTFAMLRLDITARPSAGATGIGGWQLCGVQLREWFGQ